MTKEIYDQITELDIFRKIEQTGYQHIYSPKDENRGYFLFIRDTSKISIWEHSMTIAGRDTDFPFRLEFAREYLFHLDTILREINQFDNINPIL
jgi:hypothetical protein